MCTFERRKRFTSAECVCLVRDQLLTSAREQTAELVAYCFMPDHLHALVEGCSETSDLIRMASVFRRRSGLRCRRQSGSSLWQEGYYDRVLRDDESTYDVASYIIGNPVRAGLCQDVTAYAYSGSDRYSLVDVAAMVQWKPRSLG